jgi:hypothetical protein
MSVLYGEELVASLHGQWTDKWIKAVLDMNGFLSDDSISPENIRVLESLMMTIDSQTNNIFMNICGIRTSNLIPSKSCVEEESFSM